MKQGIKGLTKRMKVKMLSRCSRCLEAFDTPKYRTAYCPECSRAIVYAKKIAKWTPERRLQAARQYARLIQQLLEANNSEKGVDE